MTDLSKILNQRIAEKLTKSQPNPNQLGQQVNFDEVFQTKKSSMTDLLSELKAQETGLDPNVQSMENININLADSEIGAPNQSAPWQKGMDLFSHMNDDFNSMQMAVEVLSDPNTKLSRQQMLAYQAGIGNMTVNVEIMSKLVQSGERAIQKLTEMQI